MSICRARFRNTSNALTFRMSVEQTRLQFQPKSKTQLFCRVEPCMGGAWKF